MSLSRLALRFAAIEALCPAAFITSGPYPTDAANRVYNSRIDLLAGSATDDEINAAIRALENRPLLVVYTEKQSTSPYGEVKYSAAEEVVTLVVEAMIAVAGTLEVPLPNGGTEVIGSIDTPITDQDHEGNLDVLEEQVRYLLNPKNHAPSSRLLPLVLMEDRDIESDPQRTADRSLRLASRTIKFTFKVKATSYPAAPGKLPEPLASVYAGLPPDSSAALFCASLIPRMRGAPALPARLEGIDIYTHLDGTASATDPDNIHGDVTFPPPA